MTTVAQLIAKLQTLPQDATVLVMGEVQKPWHIETEYRDVDLEDVWVYAGEDHTGPQTVELSAV